MSPGDRAGRVPGPARLCGTRGATVRDNRRSRRSVCVFGRTWHDGFDCLAIGFRAGRPTRSEIPDAFPLPCVPFSGARRAERIAVSVPTDCEIFGSGIGNISHGGRFIVPVPCVRVRERIRESAEHRAFSYVFFSFFVRLCGEIRPAETEIIRIRLHGDSAVSVSVSGSLRIFSLLSPRSCGRQSGSCVPLGRRHSPQQSLRDVSPHPDQVASFDRLSPQQILHLLLHICRCRPDQSAHKPIGACGCPVWI